MNLKLFYSWQTQTKGKYNKHFILKAINAAVDTLKTDPDTKNITIEVLEGTTDEPGSDPPAAVIMDERIPGCDIFIPDISIVNHYPKEVMDVLLASGNSYRPQINQNVLFEYGVAHRTFRSNNIVYRNKPI